jgi:hypothetical protein
MSDISLLQFLLAVSVRFERVWFFVMLDLFDLTKQGHKHNVFYHKQKMVYTFIVGE